MGEIIVFHKEKVLGHMHARILKTALALVAAVGICQSQCFAQEAITLVGSGGSSPVPVFHIWGQEYNKRQPTIQMEYLVLGTSESISQISKGSGDFGGGDTPLTSQQRASGNLIELPIMLMGLVPIYNVPGVHQELRFSGRLLAQIYMGEVKTWNSPQIAQLNPNATLPDLPIKVVHRTAGKGTNYIFTDFLSKSSSRFHEQVGVSVSPNWPVGAATERMSDMADKVKNEPGSIGYAELQYARDNNIAFGAVQNAAGNFVKASPESFTAACNAIEAPQWDKLSASLTNAQGADSYPLTSFSWVYVRTSSENPRRRAALLDLLNWIFTNGQHMLPGGYAQLPPQLLVKVKSKISSLQ